MKQQSKAAQVKTDRIKITVSIEVKSTLSDLNKKTACPCCGCDKR